MRQVHEMKQSTLAMSCTYLGAFGVVAGLAMAFQNSQIVWLTLSVAGIVAFGFGVMVRGKDLKADYRAYLEYVDLEDLQQAHTKKNLDATSLSLVKDELRRRKSQKAV